MKFLVTRGVSEPEKFVQLVGFVAIKSSGVRFLRGFLALDSNMVRLVNWDWGALGIFRSKAR